MSAEVRPLERAELARMAPLVAAEGWTFDEADLARLRHLGGALGAFEGEALVGALTFVDLPPIRWVGNVVVAPPARGKGLGARLVEAALADAPRVGLYAVEKAVSLYERLGFEPHGDAWAMRAESARPLRPTATEPMRADDLLEAARLDRAATGMDRGYLLRALHRAWPHGARVVRESGRLVAFGFAKTYPDLTEIGPVVGIGRDEQEAVLDALLATTGGPHEATLLGATRHARRAFEERGFASSFRTVAMFRGAPPRWEPAKLLTTAGLEKS